MNSSVITNNLQYTCSLVLHAISSRPAARARAMMIHLCSSLEVLNDWLEAMVMAVQHSHCGARVITGVGGAGGRRVEIAHVCQRNTPERERKRRPNHIRARGRGPAKFPQSEYEHLDIR